MSLGVAFRFTAIAGICALKFDDLLRGAGHPDAQIPGDLPHPDAVIQQHLQGAELGGAEFAGGVKPPDQIDTVAEALAETARGGQQRVVVL